MLQEISSDKYGVMYYKKTNSIGIRRKFGGKDTAITFGGKKCGLSEEVLRGFGDDALKKLDAGTKENTVEKWAQKAVSG